MGGWVLYVGSNAMWGGGGGRGYVQFKGLRDW